MIRKTYSTFPNFVNSSFLKKTYPHRRLINLFSLIKYGCSQKICLEWNQAFWKKVNSISYLFKQPDSIWKSVTATSGELFRKNLQWNISLDIIWKYCLTSNDISVAHHCDVASIWWCEQNLAFLLSTLAFHDQAMQHTESVSQNALRPERKTIVLR